jgi:hypothetical protein
MTNRTIKKSNKDKKQLQKGQWEQTRWAKQAVHSDDLLAPASFPPVRADIIQSAQGDVYAVDDLDYVEPETHKLVTYQVHGDQITDPKFEVVPDDLVGEQHDVKRQQEAWSLFATLIPPESRQIISQFVVITDGKDDTIAAVDYAEDDLAHWALEVDIADLDDKDALTFDLVHEFAHLLTLNKTQVSFDEELAKNPDDQTLLKNKAALCSDYFTGMGCSLPDSYVNIFYKRFWGQINAEWERIDALQYKDDLTPYYNGLHDFYESHLDQFVDDYAATHPTEDIAESFAYFVFSPKPSGNSVKEQKIKFFYEFPELVKLRDDILKGTCREFKFMAYAKPKSCQRRHVHFRRMGGRHWKRDGGGKYDR